MIKFLRYGSRHHIFFPRGFQDKVWPQLNPICSSSHGAGGKRTWAMHEPRWMYLARQRLFAHAGKQYCNRRDEFWQGNTKEKLPDSWNIKPNGDRTCSYCGSLHWDDMRRLVKRSVEFEDVSIEPSDKGYKVYVNQAGVRNASEGGIKFYMQHVVSPVSDKDNAMYSKAVKLSDARFRKRFQAVREEAPKL